MIGIFDSGIGGLTIVKEMLRVLPEYSFTYLGDTARAPYGGRSQQVIYDFTRQAVDYLMQQGCTLVVIACNTASAEALRKLQQEWLPAHYPDRRILGVIRPVAEQAVRATRFGRIGVVGTRATVDSGAFDRELKTLRVTTKVFSQACPLLVPLVEEGMLRRPETTKIIRNYLRSLHDKRIDTLILGCTHYPILYKQFQKIAGRRVKVLDSPKIVVAKLQEYLQRHPEIDTRLGKDSVHRYLATDVSETFSRNAQHWLGQPVDFVAVKLE